MVIKHIRKRNGMMVDFNIEKIINAIQKGMIAANEEDDGIAEKIAQQVQEVLNKKSDEDKDYIPNVEDIQDIVEEKLMDNGLHHVAKEYILYRQKRIEERKRDIFKKRMTIKPYEYPELAEYVDAIRHSYWIHTEFNYTSDIQDYKISVNATEREILKRALIVIAQIENSVETFWSDIYRKMPKPEIGAVGQTFAESEVRHMDAYAHLLEVLGLNEEFEKLQETPVVMERVFFLDQVINSASFESNQEYIETIFLFSLFIENASLFTLFLIVMSFNKHKNLFKGVSNVVEATSKEEQIHAMFARDIIKTVKGEHPEWFDDKYKEKVKEVSKMYFEKELGVLDYIFEDGETDFVNKKIVIEFLKNRFNKSLGWLNIDPIFDIDMSLVEQTDWFDDEVIATKHVDFFNKRSINYNKRSQSITGDDLF